jgi:hypothetical protein
MCDVVQVMGFSVDKLLVEGDGLCGDELKAKGDMLWNMGALLLLLLLLLLLIQPSNVCIKCHHTYSCVHSL